MKFGDARARIGQQVLPPVPAIDNTLDLDNALDNLFTASIARILPQISPCQRAAIDAVMKAVRTPGCLVRVSFTTADQAEETMWAIIGALQQRNLLDEEKTKESQGKTIELTNGSGIEFGWDKKC